MSTDDIPDGMNPHLQVNDHGNVTLYARHPDGTTYEVWSTV
jgi:hypothetical protein